MAKHCYDNEKYLDKQGLLYLLQILQKGIDTQITNKIIDKAITDAELERRVIEMAQSNTLITENELNAAITQMNNKLSEAKTAIKAEVKGETVTIATATATNAVNQDVDSKVYNEVSNAIANANLISKSEANSRYVMKSGDTINGNLVVNSVTTSDVVVNGAIKVQGENGKFVTKSGIVFY